jgi:hypothetical protein
VGHKFRFNIGAIAALATITILMPAVAQAYVDPSTGGQLVQLVTGGVAGLAVLFRLYWRRLRDTFSSRHHVQPAEISSSQSPDAGDR